MLRILAIVIAALSFFSVNALAEESTYEAYCAKECSFLTKDCTAYVECRVAKTTCLSDCMQRKVWESVVRVLDRLILVLEKQGKQKDETSLQPVIKQQYSKEQSPKPVLTTQAAPQTMKEETPMEEKAVVTSDY